MRITNENFKNKYDINNNKKFVCVRFFHLLKKYSLERYDCNKDFYNKKFYLVSWLFQKKIQREITSKLRFNSKKLFELQRNLVLTTSLANNIFA